MTARDTIESVIQLALQTERKLTPELYEASPGQLPSHIDHRVADIASLAVKDWLHSVGCPIDELGEGKRMKPAAFEQFEPCGRAITGLYCDGDDCYCQRRKGHEGGHNGIRHDWQPVFIIVADTPAEKESKVALGILGDEPDIPFEAFDTNTDATPQASDTDEGGASE